MAYTMFCLKAQDVVAVPSTLPLYIGISVENGGKLWKTVARLLRHYQTLKMQAIAAGKT